MKALIVDDNLINRTVLKEYVDRFGDCVTAAGGEEALELFEAALEQDPFDLICLDIGMPVMDGHETLNCIREIEQQHGIAEEQQVKVLMVTAFSDRENVLKAYQLCQGYLKKPVIGSVLAEKMKILGFFPKKETQPVEEQEPASAAPAVDQHQVDAGKEATADEDQLAALPLLIVREDALIVQCIADGGDAGEQEIKEKTLEEMRSWQNLRAGDRFVRCDESCDQLPLPHGLKMRRKDRVLCATVNGRLVYDKQGLKIVENLTVTGPVMNREIQFVGSIQVNGDVKDNAAVKGEMGVDIHGNIGDCVIESGGEITLARCYGRQSGIIKSAGNIKADCLYEATAEACGRLFIQTESIKSNLKAGDFVKCNGTVTGGQIMALNLVDVKRLGSPKDVSTSCCLGNDFRLVNRKIELEQELVEMEKQVQQKVVMLGPYADELGKALLLPETKKKRIYTLAEELDSLRRQVTQLQDDISRLEARIFFNPNAKLTVHDTLYKGVELQVGEIKELFSETIEGPVRIAANDKNREFEIEKI